MTFDNISWDEYFMSIALLSSLRSKDPNTKVGACIVSDEHRHLAAKIRDVMGVYDKNSDLVSIGAYKAGTNPKLDYALSKIDGINEFLTQGVNESFTYEQDLEIMRKLL